MVVSSVYLIVLLRSLVRSFVCFFVRLYSVCLTCLPDYKFLELVGINQYQYQYQYQNLISKATELMTHPNIIRVARRSENRTAKNSLPTGGAAEAESIHVEARDY